MDEIHLFHKLVTWESYKETSQGKILSPVVNLFRPSDFPAPELTSCLLILQEIARLFLILNAQLLASLGQMVDLRLGFLSPENRVSVRLSYMCRNGRAELALEQLSLGLL